MSSDPVTYVHENKDRFVRQLGDFLRHKSVSTEPTYREAVGRCADWLATKLRDVGLTVRVEPTPGHAAVMAERCQAPGRKTLLIYGHYDVQPAEPLDLWHSDPFEPTVREGQIYARGAVDDKGQVFTHVKALEAYLSTVGELPVNVKVLIEGEEEIGSPHLEGLLATHRQRLAADYVVISDTAMFAAGVPSICEGLRGLIYIDVTVRGPKQDLHSGGFGGVVTNPALALMRLLSELKADNGWVTIPGFYDEVRPVSASRKAQWAELEAMPGGGANEAELCEYLGVEELRGEPGYGVLYRKWARPSLDINGLSSGYQGPGSKTIIPAYASAKVSMRLVPDQDPNKLADQFEGYVRDLARLRFGRSIKVEFRRHSAAHPVLLPTETTGMAAAVRAVTAGFGKPPVFVRSGGTIPVVRSFQQILGLDSLMLGYGSPDDNAHGPNEKLSLADFHRGILTNTHLLREAAAL